MSENKDYTKYSFRISFLVIAIMLVISLIPPLSIGNIHLRRANILSDIITFADDRVDREGELTETDRHFIAEADRLEALEPSAGEQVPEHQNIEQNWDLGLSGGDERKAAAGGKHEEPDAYDLVKFEDFTPEGSFSVADFSLMMGDASENRVVRIAFLGDSYIEGDIITADVRERLQEVYGGHGVGFVPFANPLAISRPTIRHNFEGWKNYNIIYKKSAPEQYQDKFFISGTLNVPAKVVATAGYRGVGFRDHLSSWSRARLIFISQSESTVDITVNDSINRQFKPEPSDGVQQINLAGSGMRSLNVSVNAPEGFVGYGVVLEGSRGVTVDNYAIRSNSGLALFGSDRGINTQIGRMLGYDLIVLQWGLNAMDPDVTNYNAYGQQLRRVVNYIKSCFPRSAVVVMGVGDRCTQRDGKFVTMPAVRAMIEVQKAAAEECGVAFWNTFEAMGGENSMAGFVDKGWAAKDYTHLSYAGGRHIAGKFVRALQYAKFQRATGAGGFAGEDAEGGDTMQIDTSRPVRGQEQEAVRDTTATGVDAHDEYEDQSGDAAEGTDADGGSAVADDKDTGKTNEGGGAGDGGE